MIGQKILHYKILEKLGEGGMGVVYRAEDLKLKRAVALKFLPPTSPSGEEEARFRREAQTAATLNHPNICTIHAIEESDGRQFIDMEFVDGVTLRQKLPFATIGEALDVASQIAAALDEAHAKGIVHRDIKSENIMVNSKNQVKVMDFGLASLKGAMKLTKVAGTLGTLGYMAPEQIQGNVADARSDLFSFGVVLFEMLTGRMPFRGEHDAAVMYSVLNEEPPRISSLRPDVPKELDDILQKMLEKNPARRYQSVRDVVASLKPLRSTDGKQGDSDAPSIAVLAFEDMSAQKDQDYLCEGLAEEIINALTKVKALRVSARTSSFAFKGKHIDMREIGTKLNVRNVLEGSVRKSGNRLRITAQLINVADGYHLWSERYDRELRDVFEIQDEITENVVGALKLVLTEKDKKLIESVPTPEIEAYEYYLRGRKLFHKHRHRHEEAIRMFLKATEIDPRYALAYCGLADCYAFRYMYWESSEENLHQAELASRKAVDLNPDLAEAHTSLGLAISLNKQYDEAEREFEKAIRLNPRLYEVYYYYGRTCFAKGEFERAAQLYEGAVKVRPDDYQVPMLLTMVYRSLKDERRFEETIRAGIQKAEKHLELNPDDARALYLGGGALAQGGQPERGEEWLNRALELDPTNSGVLYNVACYFAVLGKIEKALTCLEKAVQKGFAHKEWIEHDSDLDAIRQEPRFVALLARMK